MKRLFLLSALCLSFLTTACDSDDTIISEVTGVVFEGTTANGFDQCGWLIEINGTPYLPNVLNSQFQQEGIRVAMKVEFLSETSNCASGTVAPQRLRIEQIRVTN